MPDGLVEVLKGKMSKQQGLDYWMPGLKGRNPRRGGWFLVSEKQMKGLGDCWSLQEYGMQLIALNCSQIHCSQDS